MTIKSFIKWWREKGQFEQRPISGTRIIQIDYFLKVYDTMPDLVKSLEEAKCLIKQENIDGLTEKIWLDRYFPGEES